MKLTTRRPQQQRRIPPEDKRTLKANVHRKTGLRLQLDDRLAHEELVELLKFDRAETLTTKQQAKREQLIEKAADVPGWFKKQRLTAATEKSLVEAARKPKPHAKMVEAGTIQIPAAVFAGLQGRQLPAVHFLLVTVVLACLQNRAVLHDRMELRGNTIVLSALEGLLGPLDPDGDVHRTAQALRELDDAGVLTVTRQGTVTISVGPVLAAAMEAATA
jgi:hypothetical protein